MSHLNPNQHFDVESWRDRQIAQRTKDALAARDAAFAEKHADTPLRELALYLARCARTLRHSPAPCEVDGGAFIIDNIQTAIGNHQQIRFQYYEYTQEKKKILKHDGYYYVVNPYALEWKNDHYYLIGFSLKHQKIAHFRVDRLTSVENLETYFMPIEGFDVASYTNKMVDMFTSESSKEVTLLCENELMRVIIDHYGEDAAVDRYDDTHFTAKIEVNPSGTFYGWIFKFKGKIKILSPKECITEMQQIAQEFI